MTTTRPQSIAHVSCPRLTRLADELPANKGRQSLVMDLIDAYDLPLIPVPVTPATTAHLEQFHSKALVKQLLKRRKSIDGDGDNNIKGFIDGLSEEESDFDPSSDDNDENDNDTNDATVGLHYDCYPFPYMRHYVRYLVGSALAAADALKRHRLVLNWYGGRHHATKSKALGFCYVNDICYTIQRLRRLRFQRVFYLDFDLHHGDGVEASYRGSSKVHTCSIHRYDVGFYPGTGGLKDNVEGQTNIPTKAGLSDSSLMQIVRDIVLPLIKDYNPDCLIIQTGCDGLASDPHKQWNLTIPGLSDAIMAVYQAVDVPTMMVGGGGYNHGDAARFWCYLTHRVTDTAPPETEEYIRDHKGLERFESDHYQFWTDTNLKPRNVRDENTSDYLQSMINIINGETGQEGHAPTLG